MPAFWEETNAWPLVTVGTESPLTVPVNVKLLPVLKMLLPSYIFVTEVLKGALFTVQLVGAPPARL